MNQAKLVEDAARSLKCKINEIPADLTDKQRDIVFGLSAGTTSVKRSRGDDPIPSYKIGRSRRTPFSAVIDYKLEQLEKFEELAA